MDWVDVLGLATICVGHIIFAPLLLYYKYQKDKLKHKDMLTIRQSSMIDVQVGLSVTGILFERLFVCGVAVWQIPALSNYQWLASSFDGLFIWGVLLLFVLRIWLLFFSMKWNKSIAKQTWTTHINPNYKSFFQHHHDTIGNFEYLLKILLIPFILFVIIESFCEHLIGSPFIIHLLALFSILCIIPSVMMYNRIDQAKDVFGIKREIGCQCIVLAIIVALHLILVILDLAHNVNDRIQWLVRLFIGSVVLFTMSFISTYFPVHLYRKRHRVNRHGMTSSRLYLHTPASSHNEGENMNQSPIQSSEHGMFRMLRVLSNERGFKAFMTHLVWYSKKDVM